MTTLTHDSTFQLGDNGVILNDDSVPNVPFVDITKVSGLDSAPFRQTKRDHEGLDGGFMDAEFETGRDIVLDGIVYVPLGQPLEPFLDQLKANYAPSTTLQPFYLLTNNSIRVLFVKPLGVHYAWDETRRTNCATVQFYLYAEKPMIFDSTVINSTITVGATIFTGFGFPLGFNFGFGGVSTTSDGQFFNNGGNRATPAVLTINGPVTNPVIYNDTTGQNLNFTTTLASGQTLVIDTYYRTVYLNGISNRRSWLTNAGWFYLQPGQNFIRFRSTNAADTGTLSVSFRPAWR